MPMLYPLLGHLVILPLLVCHHRFLTCSHGALPAALHLALQGPGLVLPRVDGNLEGTCKEMPAWVGTQPG